MNKKAPICWFSFNEEAVAMQSLDAKYREEYQNASGLTGCSTFTSILGQHTILMIDAAKPGLAELQYLQLGKRLKDVQSKWIALLCNGISDKETVDRAYRNVVIEMVENFTDGLMDVFIGKKYVSYETLASIGEMHSMVVHAEERGALKRTRELFQSHIAWLCRLHEQSTEQAFMKASLQSLYSANKLGNWLDTSI